MSTALIIQKNENETAYSEEKKLYAFRCIVNAI